MYGIVSDIFIKRPYSFFFSICPEYKIQGQYSYRIVRVPYRIGVVIKNQAR